jgi:hypothetical protein
MHDLDNNPPTRIPALHALVQNIAICGQMIESIEQDAVETNNALAFCEVVVATPIEWYSNLERMMVVAMVERLYKPGFAAFCMDTAKNEVSFYNKCAVQHGIRNTRDDVVRLLKERQAELTGA